MIIDEFEPDVFRQLIEYIHTGCVLLQARTLLGIYEYSLAFLRICNVKISLPNQKLTDHRYKPSLGLLNAADYYGLEQLRKACLRFVSCCITVDTGKIM